MLEAPGRALVKTSHSRCPGRIVERQLDATKTPGPRTAIRSEGRLHAPLPVRGSRPEARRDTKSDQTGADIDEVHGTHVGDFR